MEDDLKKTKKLEDDLKKTKKLEDDLKKIKNLFSIPYKFREKPLYDPRLPSFTNIARRHWRTMVSLDPQLR
jgi:hypothetical protein